MKTIANPTQTKTNVPALAVERGITQKEALSRTGLGKGTVMRLLAGDISVQISVLLYFCECLGLDPREAVKGDE